MFQVLGHQPRRNVDLIMADGYKVSMAINPSGQCFNFNFDSLKGLNKKDQ